ncbi:MAG TPA: polyprenol monophosphomannose synthase [Chloroflexota bacterium]|nr:polyprenol monophosphomannose synthase [Chloroflexota bacterium]
MTGRALVVLPTYNEADNLSPLIQQVLAHGVDVLVVDDASPDGTGELAEGLRAKHPSRVDVLHRSRKLGLGTAYVDGFRRALAAGYDYVLEMDCDFSHDPGYLPAFLERIQQADLVLGSRYVKGGGTVNWNAFRRFISLGGSLYSRLVLGLPYRDLTGGFKCFRRQVLEQIDLDTVRSNGYAFQIELTYRAHQRGFRIEELPILFHERRVGSSKMSRAIVLEGMLRVWQFRFGRRD